MNNILKESCQTRFQTLRGSQILLLSLMQKFASPIDTLLGRIGHSGGGTCGCVLQQETFYRIFI